MPERRWDEVRASLEAHLPRIKAQVSPDAPLGVGLRLSAVAAEALSAPAALEEFRAFLGGHDLYVFTINAFPYGPFHGTRVKEDVYQPDWLAPERLDLHRPERRNPRCAAARRNDRLGVDRAGDLQGGRRDVPRCAAPHG